MKFLSIKTLAESATNTIRRFPFEVLFALAGTIAATINANNDTHDSMSETWCFRVMIMANLGLLLSLSATLFVESRDQSAKKGWLIRCLAALFAVSLLFIINPWERNYDYIRFVLFSLGFHLLVSFAAFTVKGHIQGFWQFNKTIFLRFLGGALYSIVLFLGLLAAIHATRFLFNITLNNDIDITLFIWIAGIFNTLFFLAGVPPDTRQLDGDLSYPKALKIFTQYVLIPLSTVYVVILLAYEVKILIEWSLPKGMVSNLVLGYAVFGILSILLVYPIREQEDNKWIKTYARSFYFLLIPLIILLFLAVLARVLPYGITQQRYFLLALAVWLAFITAYFLLSRKQNIKVIPVSLCIVALLSIYGPQSALSVSRYSQRNILISIFEKYGKYKDGKLLPIGTTKLSVKDGIEAIAKLQYLGVDDKMRALQGYINRDLVAVSDSLEKTIAEKKYGYKYELSGKQTEWLNKYLGLDKIEFNKPKNNIIYNFTVEDDPLVDIKGYDYLLSIQNAYTYSDSTFVKSKQLNIVQVTDSKHNYRLKLNGKQVIFKVEPFVNAIVKDKTKIERYGQVDQYNNHNVTFPSSMLTMHAETTDYTIDFKMSSLRISVMNGKVSDYYEISGYYMIRKK